MSEHGVTLTRAVVRLMRSAKTATPRELARVISQSPHQGAGFFVRHRRAIADMLGEAVRDTGLHPHQLFTSWDIEDPLALLKHNRSILAAWAIEETASAHITPTPTPKKKVTP